VAAGPLRPGLGQGANLNPEVGEVEIGYRNHRGEQSLRRIRPLRFFYGRTRGLKTACYQLHAKDLDLGAFRDFALHDISSWRELA
jgi:predicted DNA-binding transcriptional regulator YafY